jgi:hypothetical protein
MESQMKTLGALMMLLATASVSAAPAPLPTPKQVPVSRSGFWEIDFAPLAKAEDVRFAMGIAVGRGASVCVVEEWSCRKQAKDKFEPLIRIVNRLSPKGQEGWHPGCVTLSWRGATLECRDFDGKPIDYVAVRTKGLDKKFMPIVKPPRPKGASTRNR